MGKWSIKKAGSINLGSTIEFILYLAFSGNVMAGALGRAYGNKCKTL